MKHIVLFLLCTVGTSVFAQKGMPTEAINGEYHLLEAERGLKNQPTKNKLFQFGENNGTKLLAIAACEKCMPAVYTFQEEDTKRLGVPVFFNSTGLYALGYDSNSFVIVMVTSKIEGGNWSKFMFSNFYSKSKSKVAGMTKAKAEAYATELSKK